MMLSVITLIAILSFSSVEAAIIRGSVYDLALEKERNVIVEIDTVPRQLLVAKTGDYAFSVQPGNYSLYAHTSTSGSHESISVLDDGNYTFDIVLEETLVDVGAGDPYGGSDSDINVSSGNIDLSKHPIPWIWISVGLSVVVILILGYVFIFRHRPGSKAGAKDGQKDRPNKKDKGKTEAVDDPYSAKVLQVIKKEKRTTQKDVRKEIPLSEAKISLIVADLEDKGKIRKIKKGRGNILIYVQD